MAKGLLLGISSISLLNDADNFRRYENDVKKYKILTLEQEVEYFTKYRAGETSYYEKIANHNLRFVISVAKKFQIITANSTALTLEDLISEGNLGLCIAIQKYDHTKGFKFISFAVWQIRSKITECICNHIRTIRQPSNRQNLINKLNSLEMELQQQYEMYEVPFSVLEEYAKEKNVDLYDKLIHVKTDSYFEKSLDSVVFDKDRTNGDDTMLSDYIIDNEENPQEAILSTEKKEYLNALMTRVPDRVAEFFKHYYGLNNQPQLKISEISKIMGIGHETVRFQLKRWTNRLCRYYEQEYNQQYN